MNTKLRPHIFKRNGKWITMASAKPEIPKELYKSYRFKAIRFVNKLSRLDREKALDNRK